MARGVAEGKLAGNWGGGPGAEGCIVRDYLGGGIIRASGARPQSKNWNR